MADAVTCKFVPALLTVGQIKTLIQLPGPMR
jgi:hypothetical protein